MEAEDVVQDVFVKMLETEVIIPAEKMRAWMYRVSIRRYIDRYRRDKHYLEILRKEFFGKDLVNPFENEDYAKKYDRSSAAQGSHAFRTLLFSKFHGQGDCPNYVLLSEQGQDSADAQSC